MTRTVERLAPAKVNLFLHLLGRRADGYHLLESLFVFADYGDVVTLTAAETFEFSLKGPFAHALKADVLSDEDNIMVKAMRLLEDHVGLDLSDLHMTLEKNLPVAAGIGGGSADAAATLLALNDFWQLHVPMDDLMALGAKLGADVPPCLMGRSAMVRGIGDDVTPVGDLPPLYVVLVNPLKGVSTPEVFKRFKAEGASFQRPLQDLPQGEEWQGFIGNQLNALEGPALAVLPEIADVLGALGRSAGCRLARMSGSGATCFGLYANRQEAEAAAVTLLRENPSWWVRAMVLAGDA